MTVALLSIGDELLRGEVADTNASWLAQQLERLGFEIASMVISGDDRSRLASALAELLTEHERVIATGGLGPTPDDRTAAAAADAWGVVVEQHEDAWDAIERKLRERGRPPRAGHEKQAWLPKGCEVLLNPVGTAPGFLLRSAAASLYVLPGVPSEMRAMFEEQVVPRMGSDAAQSGFSVVLHSYGVGESWIAEKLEGLELEHPEVTLGFRARAGEVDVRISARSDDQGRARERVTRAAAAARERLGDCVYGEGDQTMSHLAGRSVRSKGWHLAVAESCTGGLIARRLTREPASDFLVGGAVTYANAAKTKILGVSEDTLRGHGAVSAEVAAEMAEGARRAFDCEVAVSVTGIAGPSGATADKPVGLVHWAVAHPGGTVLEERVFSGNRNQIQEQAATAALDLLRRTLKNDASRRTR